MSTRVTAQVWNNGSVGAFRLWTQEIHDAITAAGWVQTADTGQVTIASMALPGTTSTAAGYLIYRMDDALQATYPCYLKVEPASSASTTARPGLFLTVGTGTDGAGTITGIVGTRTHLTASITETATHSHYSSGSTGRFAMFVGITGSSASSANTFWYWSVSRFYDENGDPSGDGFLTVMVDKATSTTSRLRYQMTGCSAGDFGALTQQSNAWSHYPIEGGNVSGQAVGLYPFVPAVGRPYPPIWDLGLWIGGSHVPFNKIDFEINGNAFRWMAMENQITSMTNDPRVFMRWD
jgi:hypothetical protein